MVKRVIMYNLRAADTHWQVRLQQMALIPQCKSIRTTAQPFSSPDGVVSQT
jgi:hypothetical protein